MAQVQGMGNTFNLPNYAGEVYTADSINTPFLTMIGGLSEGGFVTDNCEFATAALYDFPAAAQPSITEEDSVVAPWGTEYVREQEKNVTQIFHESIRLSYSKLSNSGRLSGVTTLNGSNVPDELDFQIARALKKIARDIEFTFLNGKYNLASSSAQANKTRGMIEVCGGTNTIDADGELISKEMFNSLIKMMADNGAGFGEMVLFCNSFNKQILSQIFSPSSGLLCANERNIGGVSIDTVITDFAKIGIVWNRFMPQDTILVADMSVIAPVLQPVPDKGAFFVEELAKQGAASEWQVFGQIGLDHGPKFMHGTITNLKTE